MTIFICLAMYGLNKVVVPHEQLFYLSQRIHKRYVHKEKKVFLQKMQMQPEKKAVFWQDGCRVWLPLEIIKMSPLQCMQRILWPP